MFQNNVAWKKTTATSCFDVTMGIYDGAEVCKLLGTFISPKLGNIIDKKNRGIYCDDGLVILRNTNAREIEKMRKIVKEIGFQIEIETILKNVYFLDITFNLITRLYTPYKKPN